MLKKSLIFGSVALLITALIALTGCSQATDGKTTVFRENYIYGKAVPADSAQAIIEKALTADRPIILADGLEFYDNDAVVDFKDAKVRVEGTVRIKGNLILNTAHATVDYVQGGLVIVDSGAYFIYNGDGEAITGLTTGGGTRVQYTENPLIVTGTADHIAVDNYTIGKDFLNIKPEVDAVFVLKTLTISGESADPTNEKVFRALGNVDVVGNNDKTIASGDFVFGPGSVLTNSAGDVSVTVPTLALLRNVAPIAGSTITVTNKKADANNDPITLTIKEAVRGPGELALKGGFDGADVYFSGLTLTEVAEGGKVRIDPAIDDDGVVTITKNAGSIDFANVVLGGADGGVNIGTNAETGEITFLPPFTAAGELLVTPITATTNNGTIRFADNVKLGADFTGIKGGAGQVLFAGSLNADAFAVTLGTKVVFGTNFLRTPTTNMVTTFNGDVVLTYDNSTLDFGSAASQVNVILGAGKTIYVGDAPILGAGDTPLTLALPASVSFTLSSVGASVDAEEADVQAALHTLTFSNPWDSTSAGVLKVRPGAILNIPGDKTFETSGTVSLALEDGATLQFGYVSGNSEAGKLDIGDTVITSSTAAVAGTLSAQGGTVTFGNNKIEGSGAAKLVTVEDTPFAITLSDSSKSLTLKAVDLDLQTGASLVIEPTSGVSAYNKVILERGAVPGKITFGAGPGSPVPSSGLPGTLGFGRTGNLDGKANNGIITTTTGDLEGELVSLSGGLKTNLNILGYDNNTGTVTLVADTEISQ
jgi:hypothetical protein